MFLRLLIATGFCVLVDSAAIAADVPQPRIATRIFFQDDDAKSLRWADVKVGETTTVTTPQAVTGFPSLDPMKQSLVQMEAAGGYLLVGVRDEENGQFQSGWVLVETGVEEEEHGDHSHWQYPHAPRVRAAQLDDKQGNPAHLYCYDDIFYLANDKRDGYTRIDPQSISMNDSADAVRQKAHFIPGGGGHITLAVVNKNLGFSSWIDRVGPHKGRVDITPYQGTASKIAATITLPSGGIHGATTAHGKVFFAPTDGICWIDAAALPLNDPKQITVHHLSLGKLNDKPLRTGSFTTLGRHVAFVTGSGEHTQVGFIDASRSHVELSHVSLKLAEGNRAVGPYLVQPRKGSPLGFVFHDHAADSDAPNRLTLLELDPNGDGQWTDAKVAEEMDVGKSRVEGHSGHHALDFDADRRRAIFTNPGDSTVVVYSLAERKPVAEVKVGGTPSKIVAVGGRASGH